MGIKYADIRKRVQAGYNLAMEVPLDYKPDKETVLQDFLSLRSIPVLQEATGIEGILREMDLPGRCPGIRARMAEDGQEHKIMHLLIGPEKYTIHSYRFTVSQEVRHGR